MWEWNTGSVFGVWHIKFELGAIQFYRPLSFIHIKGEQKTSLARFSFAHNFVRLHQNFKIIVPNPHNNPIFMGGTLKNFEDPMQSDQVMRKTKSG